jgi:hypothetical protein
VDAVEAGHNKGANEKTDSRQRQQRRERKTDEAQCGECGFSRMFHTTKVKISRATCNSAFWRQCKFVEKSGALPERHRTKGEKLWPKTTVLI